MLLAGPEGMGVGVTDAEADTVGDGVVVVVAAVSTEGACGCCVEPAGVEQPDSSNAATPSGAIRFFNFPPS